MKNLWHTHVHAVGWKVAFPNVHPNHNPPTPEECDLDGPSSVFGRHEMPKIPVRDHVRPLPNACSRVPKRPAGAT